MPMLGLLFKALLGNMYAAWLLMVSGKQAIRIAFAVGMASAYVLCVVGFSTFIVPLISSLFNTQYGQVVGLAFPPIAGTVVAGIVTLWACVVTKRYYVKFGTLALPH